MKFKKLLSIEDLVNFCREQKMYSFNAKDAKQQIVVQYPSQFSIDEEHKDDTLAFYYIKAFHIGANNNTSNVTKEAAENVLDKMAYKPVLANFCNFTDEHGETVRDFTSHDMVIDDDGKVSYIERQVGCFTADKAYIKKDDDNGKEYVFARCAIPREYTDAAQIIDRKNGTTVSVELIVNAMDFDVKNNILNLTDITVSGITCLGRNPETYDEVLPGMEGAKLSISDFSAENNSICQKTYEQQDVNKLMIETLEKLNSTISNFNKKSDTKEGDSDMNHFEELLEKYGVEKSECDFDYESMNDDELDAKFEDLFGCKKKKKCDDESGDGSTVTGKMADEDEEDDSVPSKKKKTDGTYELSFKLSHDDVRCGLYNLLEQYNDDCCWDYILEIYDDCFIYMHGTEYYKRQYTKTDDTVAFEGDAVRVYNEWLTEPQRTALEALKADYAALKQFKDEYSSAKDKAEKDAIFAREEYSEICGCDEFKALAKDASKYSVDELVVNCDLIFANHMKKQFSTSGYKKKNSVSYNFNTKPEDKKDTYGGLFS